MLIRGTCSFLSHLDPVVIEIQPGFDVGLYEPVPLVSKLSTEVILNVLVMGQCQMKVKLRHDDIKWISDADNCFIDIDRTWCSELNREM